jgi:membrane-bound serine protease (ClpP class)
MGGIAAFVFGAIIMFDSGVPGFGISYTFVMGLGLVFAVLLIWLLSFLLKLRRRGAVSGADSILGGTATAMEDFADAGSVWLEGEAWNARSQVPVTKDEQLIVTRLDGLTLDVEPVTKPEPPASE